MTSKERMLIALNKGKPDRLPVSVHQWQKFHLDTYLAGISDLEAFEMFGMGQFNVLTDGTPEGIRSMVFNLFEKTGYDGGYILSCADHFFSTSPKNLRVYTEAAKDCVY